MKENTNTYTLRTLTLSGDPYIISVFKLYISGALIRFDVSTSPSESLNVTNTPRGDMYV